MLFYFKNVNLCNFIKCIFKIKIIYELRLVVG